MRKKLSAISYQLSARQKAQRGFTLIELLVTISIIAIIATVGFVTYSQAQVSARDSRRKEDLKAIRTAVEVYYSQTRSYPGTNTVWSKSSAGGTWIVQLDSKYFQGGNVPVDPKNTGSAAAPTTTAGLFLYYYQGCDVGNGGVNSVGYSIVAYLENTNDPEANSVKIYTSCGSSAASFGGNAYILSN